VEDIAPEEPETLLEVIRGQHLQVRHRVLEAGGEFGDRVDDRVRERVALGVVPGPVGGLIRDVLHETAHDDLILAIAGHLIDEAMAGLTAHDCWVDTLVDGTRRLRRTYRLHPAAAALSACRTTQRPAEMGIVNLLIGAVLSAGFEGAEAARVYRAIGDFALAWAGFDAAFLALDKNLQETDQAAWSRAYLAADRSVHPHIWQIRKELPDIGADDIFETILSLVIDGLTRRAPRPCVCAAHSRGGSGEARVR